MPPIFFIYRHHDVHPHLSWADALDKFEVTKPQIAFIDFYMPEGTGVELMRRLHEKDPTLPVVILTASHDVNDAIESTKAGAYHHLTKPIKLDKMFRRDLFWDSGAVFIH